MRVFLIILRVFVLMTALVGVTTTGGCGYLGWSASQEKVLEKLRKEQAAWHVLAPTNPSYQSNLTAANIAVDLAESSERVYPFLLAGAALGLLGGLLAVFGYTNSGALLLLVTGLGPALLSTASLFFTSPLVAAGFGSLFVSFLAFVTKPKAGEESDAEEEEEKPKTRPKRPPDEEEEEAGLDEVEEVEEVEECVVKKPAAKRPAVEDEVEEVEEEEEEAPPPKRGKRK
jgi:hypothetical protein